MCNCSYSTHSNCLEESVPKIEIEKSLENLLDNFKDSWLYVSKQKIEEADGRKDPTNLISKKGSILYVAYENEHALYVGESSKSIKRRFITDGSGSHKEACSKWFVRMTHVKYAHFTHSELPDMHRKFIEQALSISISPEFYGSRV